MPQFSKQSSRPMSPRSYAAAVRRGRKLLELIERQSTPQHTGYPWCECEAGGTCDTERRRKQQLTRAINGMAAWAKDLSRRHRGLSVGQEMDETAASLGRLGGQAGTGESKRRGTDDPDYYKRLSARRWGKKPAPDKPAP